MILECPSVSQTVFSALDRWDDGEAAFTWKHQTSVQLGDGQTAADLYGVDGRQRRHAMVEVKKLMAVHQHEEARVFAMDLNLNKHPRQKTGDSAISNTWLQHDFNFKSPVRVPVVMHNLLFLLGPWLFCAINRWYWPWKAVLRWRGNMVLTSPPHPSYQKHRRFAKSPGLQIVRTYPEPRLHSRTSDWCRNCPRESKNIQYSIQ